MLASQTLTPSICFRVLTAAGFVAQLMSVRTLWGQQSADVELLGRYSAGYAIILMLNILLILFWGILTVRHRQVENWLQRWSGSCRMGVTGIAGLIVLGIWLTSVDSEIKQYLATNWLVLSALFIYVTPDQAIRWRWQWFLLGGLVVLLLPAFITVLANRRFRPDEAHWADYATTFFRTDGVYARTWLQEPVVIAPGVGWSVAGYGWLLKNVAFRPETGRVWNFATYLLAFVGVGAVSWRLYGREAAIISLAFAALSRAFILAFEYRPDHQLPVAATLVLFTAIQARYRQRQGIQMSWHFLCGLAATLALELHAAGVVFPAGLTLFYVAEWGYLSFRQRRVASIIHLLSFGAGAFIGVSIYYFLNIQPVGGLEPFLDVLIGERWQRPSILRSLQWPSLQEGLVLVAAFGYILWRRRRADRLFLSILACIFLAIHYLDSPGYRTTFNALVVIPVGTLIVDGFAAPGMATGKNLRAILVAATLMFALASSMIGEIINWPNFAHWVRTGELPSFLYEDLKLTLTPFIQEDDVIVSTHQLIWTIPDHPNLYSFAAEATGMERWGLTDPASVWERVQPTVVVYIDGQMHFDPGLRRFMDEHSFQSCASLDVQGTAITIFRPDCLDRFDAHQVDVIDSANR